MKNEMICAAMAQPKQNKAQKVLGNVLGFGTAISAVAGTAATTVFAQDGGTWDSATIGGSANAETMMGKIIGVLLTISRYVGVALVIYGVYEVVMSFMQNQPEAKTKGIVMALSGAVMVSLKSICIQVGVITS